MMRRFLVRLLLTSILSTRSAGFNRFIRSERARPDFGHVLEVAIFSNDDLVAYPSLLPKPLRSPHKMLQGKVAQRGWAVKLAVGSHLGEALFRQKIQNFSSLFVGPILPETGPPGAYSFLPGDRPARPDRRGGRPAPRRNAPDPNRALRVGISLSN